MAFSVREYLKKLQWNQKDESGKVAFTFTLDMESVDRFKRLKGRLNHMDDDLMIALALKALERKVDRLIKRKRRRKTIMRVR